jgi:hypothetical protein
MLAIRTDDIRLCRGSCVAASGRTNILNIQAYTLFSSHNEEKKKSDYKKISRIYIWPGIYGLYLKVQ